MRLVLLSVWLLFQNLIAYFCQHKSYDRMAAAGPGRHGLLTTDGKAGES